MDLADPGVPLAGHTITQVRWGDERKLSEPDFHVRWLTDRLDNDKYQVPVEVHTSAGLVVITPWVEHDGSYRHAVLLEFPGHREEQLV